MKLFRKLKKQEPPTPEPLPQPVNVKLLGSDSVGKSNLILRYTENTFHNGYLRTIGPEFKIKHTTVDDLQLKIKVWDFPDKYQYSSYRRTGCTIIVFDLANRESFADLRYHFNICSRYCSPLENRQLPVIVVGNKSDLPERPTTRKEIEELCETFDVPYMETSGLTGEGVDEMFEAAARIALLTRPLEK